MWTLLNKFLTSIVIYNHFEILEIEDIDYTGLIERTKWWIQIVSDTDYPYAYRYDSKPIIVNGFYLQKEAQIINISLVTMGQF